MNTNAPHPHTASRARRLAQWVVRYPKTNVLLSLLLMAALLSALPQLYKDTRADAFLADDNPALLYKNKVKAQFGLSDPIVVAVVNEGEHGVFNPGSLALVDWLSTKISALENVNSDRVISLATENNITGIGDDMVVEPFFEVFPDTQASADEVWRQVSDFPLYMGNVVAHNKQATLIVAELLDEEHAEASYNAIVQLAQQAPLSSGDIIHVAGEGAIAGFLGSYIDADAGRLNPIAGLVITLIILLAFRRFSIALLANVIIAASVLMTLAAMALSGVPFFVITNALPVILIGISVADSVHIFSHYFELQAAGPERDKKELIVETLEEMWRPITLTTLTTMAGFIGLYLAAYMPPFKYFGLFTAFGVAVAWLYSLVFLPAAMALIQPTASRPMQRLAEGTSVDTLSALMVRLGAVTLGHSRKVIAVFALIVATGLFAALQLTVDEDRIKTFHPSEPLFQADQAINRFLNGTNNLDIVIEAAYSEGLFEPESLYKMQALQEYALTLENVQGATSIVDYLKQINRALNGGKASAYVLPDDRNLVAQYFLIYSASSDPTDFENVIDYDYRVANMRLSLNKGSYQDTKEVIHALEDYIAEHFTRAELSATLSGRVTVNYHWIKDLGESHFIGLSLSLFLVWAVASLLFGSATAGLFAILPVASSILLVYAAMVAFGITLGIGTSMFASVAIGLGVDFAIHTIERLRSGFAANRGDWDKTLTQLYPSTGRALLLNYLAISLGFGVLISSEVVPLSNFGTIVFISVTTSFLASLSLLPALIKVLKPRFISDYYAAAQPAGTAQSPEEVPMSANGFSPAKFLRLSVIVTAIGVLGFFFVSSQVQASPLPSADAIVDNVNNVDDGEHVTRNLLMTMVDKRGKVRQRETRTYRKYYQGEKRTIIFYKKPSNVKGTAFLTFDYADSGRDDDQWLYLPALRKVRRISASDRGDYFLGTDFTYEDIMLEGKLERSDYDFAVVREERLELDNGDTYDAVLMRSTPKNEAVAQELGYGRTEFWVDTSTWLIVKANYWDTKGKLLKTMVMSDIREVDGILTRHRLAIDNHKTGHHTTFEFSDVDYLAPVRDKMFTQRAMKQGK